MALSVPVGGCYNSAAFMMVLQSMAAPTDLLKLVPDTLVKLSLAAFLGGVIGLERELKGKAAGLRTNLLICFGSAMFTILSAELASVWTGDHTRIAAQIIPGIGFIGAGSILHARGSVSGLTTAATIFVVASIGMAVGGGLYLPAAFATLMIFLALEVLGWIERRLRLKPGLATYELVGEDAETLIGSINGALEELHKSMQSIQVGRVDGHVRVQFSVEASSTEQQDIFLRLRTAPGAIRAESLGEVQERE